MAECYVSRSTLFRRAASQETFGLRRAPADRRVSPVLCRLNPRLETPPWLVTSARGALVSHIQVRWRRPYKADRGLAMTLADITLAIFTICNSLRVLAYAPQIVKAAADRGGVEAISFMTSGLFLLSNVSG